MPLYKAMDQLLANVPASENQARQFLSTLSPTVQEQLINAIYLGRDHIHADTFSSDAWLSREATDHIPQENYATIVYEKGNSLPTYLDSVRRCAANANFDLNKL